MGVYTPAADKLTTELQTAIADLSQQPSTIGAIDPQYGIATGYVLKPAR